MLKGAALGTHTPTLGVQKVIKDKVFVVNKVLGKLNMSDSPPEVTPCANGCSRCLLGLEATLCGPGASSAFYEQFFFFFASDSHAAMILCALKVVNHKIHETRRL